MNYARFFIWIDFFILFYCYETWSPLVSNCHESHRTVAALLCEQASKKSVFRWSISVYLYNYKASLVDTHSSSQCFPYSSFPACCGGLLVTPELALSCWSSAASFSPLKHLQKSVPQPCVMNKEALPLFPWVLFPCCYTECVLLTKPVMDVGLPLSLCLPDKEGISLHCNRGHTHRQTCKHTLMHSPNIHPPSSWRSCIQWSTNLCPDPDTPNTSASIWHWQNIHVYSKQSRFSAF